MKKEENLQLKITNESINVNKKDSLGVSQTVLIPAIGLIKLKEGIIAIFDFWNKLELELNEIGIAKTDSGLFLRISDRKNEHHFAISIQKIFDFVEENKSDKIQIALYNLGTLGEYLIPIGGVTITKEQIYEMKGIVRMITVNANKGYLD